MHTLMLMIYCLIALLTFVIYRIIVSSIEQQRFKDWAEQHGCKPPRETDRTLWETLQRLRRMIKVTTSGEDFFDDILGPEFKNANTIAEYSPLDPKGSFLTNEPENIKALLATQFNDFETGSWRYETFKPLLGRSIFSSDGAFWEHSRALLRPQFARENVNDLEFTGKAVDKLIQRFGQLDSKWTKGVNLLDLLYDFTLATGTDFLFAQPIDMQTDASKDSKRQDFVNAFALVSEVITNRARLGFLRWLPGVGDGIAFRRALHYLDSFTEKFISEAQHERLTGKSEKQKKHSLLKSLAEEIQDPDEIRHQSMAVLFAGRDTTAALLGWSFVRLALHADIFEKLRSAILEDFSPGTVPSFSELKGCRYLQHFLNEVLRLHPPIGLNNRTAVKDTTLPVGGGPDQKSPIAVPKGVPVNFGVYFVQRRKDLWGEDALEFKPERWETARPGWQYLPFLGGPRMCLGQQFALTEASMVLVKVLLQFDAIEPVDRKEMAMLRNGLGVTMAPRDGAKVRLRRAA